MRTARCANVSQLTSRLWIGGDLAIERPNLAAAQLAEIETLEITDIVDCRQEWNDQDWVGAAAPQLRYRWLGVDDAGQRMPDEWFETGTAYILRRIAEGGVVLAHCHMGINRGPSMGYAAMLALGWDPIAALDRIRQRRHVAYVGYAEDALDWWLRRQHAGRGARAAGHELVAQWRRDNHLDVTTVIRKIRAEEGA